MSSPSALKHLLGFRLTTADPDRLAAFYAVGLGFSVGAAAPISTNEMERLGLGGAGYRLSLSLGDQHLDLDTFQMAGRPYPADATAADLDFQHLAIVVTDAGEAFNRALANGATTISTDGPVQLPASAGAVIAVKFHDPEGHPLEFLQFTDDRPAAWRNPNGRRGALGIDHSAISVADADASTRFYEALGLHLGRRTLNRGETQAALDGLTAPQVDVVPLVASEETPHLELLGYRAPKGRRAALYAANDAVATRIIWASDRDELLKDPDGHLHVLEQRS